MKYILYAGLLLAAGGAAAADPADPWLGIDKFYHWGSSCLLTVGGYGVLRMAREDENVSSGLAAMWTLTIGLAKEDIDLKERNRFFSVRDLAADCLGIFTGLGIIYLVAD